MTIMTPEQALALLDALRAELAADPGAFFVGVDWSPAALLVSVGERRGLTEHRLTRLLLAAQGAAPAPRAPLPLTADVLRGLRALAGLVERIDHGENEGEYTCGAPNSLLDADEQEPVRQALAWLEQTAPEGTVKP